MGRKGNQVRLNEIVRLVQERQGQNAASIAKMLGLDKKIVSRALAQLEERGDLLAEDDQGRLSWFGFRW